MMCALVALLAGCRANEQCSAAIQCGAGSYSACSDGSSCRYQTSDGKSFGCGSCADCQGAVMRAVTWCGGAAAGGGVGGNGAGTIAQTKACADYLACAAGLDPTQLASLTMTYGPAGSCWTTAATASGCDAACTAALAIRGLQRQR